MYYTLKKKKQPTYRFRSIIKVCQNLLFFIFLTKRKTKLSFYKFLNQKMLNIALIAMVS